MLEMGVEDFYKNICINNKVIKIIEIA